MLCGEACSRSRLQAARDDRVAVQLPERLAPVDVDDQTIRFGLIDAVRVVVEGGVVLYAGPGGPTGTGTIVTRAPAGGSVPSA